MALGEIWLESQRLLIVGQRFVESSLQAADYSQVEVGHDEAGLASHRLLVLDRCFVELALGRKHVAQVVHFGEAGLEGKNLAIGRGSLGQPPGTMFALCQGNQLF